ncbi:hypothetical protein BJ970_003481 [Saccharopolyspora phatthalungensis]|uniref:Uncharacterized protein n=1 Tax=Saccharopolyspora phatthalungensis TaxID=664693 RepID=A0A840Q7N1_9PSEU|nr:hypothetical protein [Saccharopolyspora phatthalungensis]
MALQPLVNLSWLTACGGDLPPRVQRPAEEQEQHRAQQQPNEAFGMPAPQYRRGQTRSWERATALGIPEWQPWQCIPS